MFTYLIRSHLKLKPGSLKYVCLLTKQNASISTSTCLLADKLDYKNVKLKFDTGLIIFY